ncbi:hypothetical protein CENSYa_1373 [Cenarchaeum symbiosum A]|uniref:Uncharacterized protein n=1 Tax=Cenarchaeum symbiosum (strain A) TaxID=414004 RepID=A0RXC9_CENSY|nr:hypothetical protein CENSYa_1373 [Cenarchaeum symbiosum A]
MIITYGHAHFVDPVEWTAAQDLHYPPIYKLDKYQTPRHHTVNRSGMDGSTGFRQSHHHGFFLGPLSRFNPGVTQNTLSTLDRLTI